MGASTRNWQADAIAGVSVAGLMLPEAVAYAGIAGLPPGRAIIAAISGGLIYVAVGRSRFAVVAPTSSSAAILAAALATLSISGTDKILMTTAIVFAVGIAFIAMGVLRLGSVAAFISRPVLRGFAFGLALTIIAKQLPTLLGLHLKAPNFSATLAELAEGIGQANFASLAIGSAALGLLLALRRWSYLPGALIVLVSGIALSWLVNLPAHGVASVGTISLTLEPPQLPIYGFERWAKIVQLALPLALILFAESWGTMRALALRHGDTLSANRELLALGGANLISAVAQGMPVGAGFSAGSASEAAGATSRLTAIVAVLGLTAMVLLASPAIARLPEPVLAAVVIAALTHALSPAPIFRLFRIDRDQWIAIAAAMGVILLGVLNGMLFAVALSLMALLARLARPVVSQLGQLGASHDFVDVKQHPEAASVPGVAIFRPNAPLFFANADAALGQIARNSQALAVGTTIVLSLEESDDLDSSAVEALGDLQNMLVSRAMPLRLARLHDRARAVLDAAGLTNLTQDAGFSVADTVQHAIDNKDVPHAK
jgi:MFS superfamily sulfate permease-like transporter